MSLGQLQGCVLTRAARIRNLGANTREILRRFVLGAPSQVRRDSLLLDAAVDIRSGSADEALKRLRRYLNVLTRDPVYLNLLGAAHESLGRLGYAHELYRVALVADGYYGPAKRNILRLNQWDGDASTWRPAQLGDVELRAHRSVNRVKKIPEAPTPARAKPAAASNRTPTRFVIITRCT